MQVKETGPTEITSNVHFKLTNMKISDEFDVENRFRRLEKFIFKPYRLRDNPDETKFLEEFSKFKDIEISRIVTGTLDGSTPTKFLSEEEIKLTKSTIQWLGTSVGRGFLDRCGFTNK